MRMIFMSRNPLTAVTVALLAVGVLTGCGSGRAGQGDPRVVAGFYPLQFVVEQVGGEQVRVSNLAEPGAEPHDLELTPRQVAQVAEADLVVYLEGFQPALDEAVAGQARDTALDVATVEPLRDGYVPIEDGELHQDEKGKDPHVWLDPVRLAGIADAVARRLGDVHPEHAATFSANAAALRRQLTGLDREFARGLASCAQRTIVVSHNAFGYLAQRYRLQHVPITGFTPEQEPSAGRLAEVAAFMRAHRVRVIFFETLVSPRVARTLAREVGASTAVLDPIEGRELGSDQNYLSLMRTNLRTLREALRCT